MTEHESPSAEVLAAKVAAAGGMESLKASGVMDELMVGIAS
ncbi:hypothetical protein IWX64_002561 [Arthrobacter sp. CAN_A212]